MGRVHLESIDIARQMVSIASEKQAEDIVLLDVRELVSYCDYFVLMSGASGRQLSAIADTVEKTFKPLKIGPRHREGDADSGWILLDFGGVIAHIFTPEIRSYYKLDRLWENAPKLVSVQ